MGLTYDKSSHSLELTVRNTGQDKYCIKSALRLMQPANEVLEQVADEGNVPMAAAKASVGDRNLFQLLAEDDAPVMIEPNETRTLVYGLMVPAEYLNLDDSKNVEVHISYGEDSVPVPGIEKQAIDSDDSISINMDAGEVIAEAFLIEDLLEAVKNSPDDAIGYHMKEGNDFANWVRHVVGDESLANQLDAVEYTDDAQTKSVLVNVLESKVDSLRHPYLRRVPFDNKFVLKADHDNILSEVVLLEELGEAMAQAPADIMPFHMVQGNDFAQWVQNAIGDESLAASLHAVDASDPSKAKDQMVSLIRERVDSLKS